MISAGQAQMTELLPISFVYTLSKDIGKLVWRLFKPHKRDSTDSNGKSSSLFIYSSRIDAIKYCINASQNPKLTHIRNNCLRYKYYATTWSLLSTSEHDVIFIKWID